MQVTIVGTGYVGLTTGVCLAYLGHRVFCLDKDAAKIEMLRTGKSPIYEPHLEELMARARQNLAFTTSYEEAVPVSEIVFITVGTPPAPSGNPDLRYVREAAEWVGRNLGEGFTVIINKSTVPIGSGNWVGSLIREAYQGRHGRKPDRIFSVASNPEFLREGSALQDSLYPDRIVVGADDQRCLEVLYTLYRPILDQSFNPPPFLPRPEGLGAVPLVATDLASAELIKYAANCFLALKISYINEIGQLAEKVGADILQVARGIGLDNRIGTRFLQAGIGWGGSCFGKDSAALLATAEEYKIRMPIVAAAREINQRQRERLVDKLLGELKILKGRTVGLLGLAFKPHTDDLRDAPAVDIAARLIGHGCHVRAHDPVAMGRFRSEYPDLAVTCCEDVISLATDADALVLVTEWPQYRALPWAEVLSRMASRIVLDGRHTLDRAALEALGARYLTLAG